MSRYFTVTQAERLLPQVERLLRDALFQKEEYQAADRELNALLEKIRIAGGTRVNPGPILALRARRDSGGRALKGTFEELEKIGVLIKDLEIGLIDFLSRYQGREVCLCWKLGESGIRFWHSTEEGFRGRKPIDEEFLANHQGEPTN